MVRRFAIWVVNTYLFLFCGHRIYGKNHFPAEGGIVCGNHVSFLDPPIIGCSAPGVVHFLGRDTLFKWAPFAWLLRQLYTHPVRRGKGNIHALKLAMELIQGGNKVAIFPEGRRSPDGNFLPGELGVGMLVQKTGCLVIPVYVHGTYQLWNSKRRFPRWRGKTACVFGSSLSFDDILSGEKKQVQKEIVERIMDRIAALKEWYESGASGSPP